MAFFLNYSWRRRLISPYCCPVLPGKVGADCKPACKDEARAQWKITAYVSGINRIEVNFPAWRGKVLELDRGDAYVTVW